MTGSGEDAVYPVRWQTTVEGRSLHVMVRRQAINLLLDNDSPSFTFDPAGRLHGAFVERRNYRRSLDNRMLAKWSEQDGTRSTRRRRWLSADEARTVVDLAYEMAARAAGPAGDAPAAIQTSLERVTGWTWPRLDADRRRFESIYTPVGILPPDQYLALVLQATHGCSHNACTFCTFYQDIPFRIKSPDEFRSHVAGVLDFFGPALAMRRSIFLADANALVVPMPRLLALLDVLADGLESEIRETGKPGAAATISEPSPLGPDALPDPTFPHLPPATCSLPPATLPLFAFIDAFHVERKSVADWQELRGRGLQRVYIGMESGHDPLLRWLNKPGNAVDVLDAVQTLKTAGVAVSVIVMSGVGGAAFADAHVRDSVALLNAMPLGWGDLIYISEFREQPGSDYVRMAAQNDVRALAPDELHAQTRMLRNEYRAPDPNQPPQFSAYNIDEFIY